MHGRRVCTCAECAFSWDLSPEPLRRYHARAKIWVLQSVPQAPNLPGVQNSCTWRALIPSFTFAGGGGIYWLQRCSERRGQAIGWWTAV